MFDSRLGKLALAASFLVVSPLALHAQGTSLVPSSNLVYADIERLAELGVLDRAILGQRPYSRRELARLAAVARANIEGPRASVGVARGDVALVNEMLRRLGRAADEAGEESGGPVVVPIEGLSLTVSSTDALRRGFPAPGTMPTEATIDPLATRRLGRPAVRGQVASLELSHRVEPTGWLALHLRERLEYRNAADAGVSSTTGEVLIASARARARNVAVTVGRQQITWAQSAGDGLLLASDAPALDMISIAGDSPFTLPSLLRYFGPMQATVLLADLGPSRVRTGSKLLAYKVSIQPARTFEIGGTFLNHFGGEGARSSSFGNTLIDFLPFIDVFRKHNYTDSTGTLDVDSDKVVGVDARWRIPALGGVVLTGEALIDDFDTRRLPKLLTGYGAQSLSLLVPKIITPAISAKLSAKHMGIVTYSHAQLTGGMTTRGRLLGDELGPDAKAFSALVRWDRSEVMRLEVEARHAIYSNATYRAYYSDAAQTLYEVQKVSSTPDERRDRLLGSVVVQRAGGIAVVARGGLEQTRNAAFQGGRRRDYVAELAVRVRH